MNATITGAASALRHDACLTSGQCLNGGTCSVADEDTSDFRHCHCPDGFTGFRCENYCPLQCQNAGVCQLVGNSDRIESYIHDSKKNKNNYVCKCKGYFTGKLCQTRYVNCGGHQCLNGATCAARGIGDDNSNTATSWCDCAAGYAGARCEFPIAMDSTAQQKSTVAGAALGALLGAAIVSLLLVFGVRRRRRQAKWMDRQQQSLEERQKLHTSLPREEREDWECRNII